MFDFVYFKNVGLSKYLLQPVSSRLPTRWSTMGRSIEYIKYIQKAICKYISLLGCICTNIYNLTPKVLFNYICIIPEIIHNLYILKCLEFTILIFYKYLYSQLLNIKNKNI